MARGRHLLPTSARLWPQLTELFGFINKGEPPLHIATFNGGLFDPAKHPFLERYAVGDAHLQQAIDMLARVNGEFIDYRDLTVRHMGTIYEGLLEFKLVPSSDSGTGVPPVGSHGRDGHATAPSGTGVPPVGSHSRDGHATAPSGTGVPPVGSHGRDGHATAPQWHGRPRPWVPMAETAMPLITSSTTQQSKSDTAHICRIGQLRVAYIRSIFA